MVVEVTNAPESKTFMLGSPYDLLGKLYSDMNDLSEAPTWNSSLRSYRAINCFLTLWHMTDWFWVALRKDKTAFARWRNEHPKETIDMFRERLCQMSPAMRAAQQIATASKHLNVNHNDAGVVTDILYQAENEQGYRQPIDIVIRIDGIIVSVEMALAEGRDFWRHFLHAALPEPRFFPGDDDSVLMKWDEMRSSIRS